MKGTKTMPSSAANVKIIKIYTQYKASIQKLQIPERLFVSKLKTKHYIDSKRYEKNSSVKCHGK